MIEVELPDGTVIEFPEGTSDAEITAALQRAYPPREYSPLGIASDVASGFNRGLVALPDLVSRPLTEGFQALGANIANEPLRAMAEQTGFVNPPVTPSGEFIQRASEDVGASVLPAGALLQAARTGAGVTNTLIGPMVRAVQSAPARTTAAELGLAAGSGLGAAAAQQLAPGSVGAELAGGFVGGLAPSAIGPTVRGVLRGGDESRALMEENLAAFERAGVEPSVGQITGRLLPQSIEASASNWPGGYQLAAARARETADALGERTRQMAEQLSRRSSAEDAGRAVIQGIQGRGGFMRRFNDTAETLYNDLDSFIGKGTPIAVINSRQTLRDLSSPIIGARKTSQQLLNPKVSSIAKAFEADAGKSVVMPYDAVKQLRSRVGRELSNPTLQSDIPTAQLKRVYAALSEDMRQAATAAGPEAMQAFRRADNYYKAGLDRIEKFLDPLVKRKTPEEVFRAATRGAEGPTMIRKVRRSVRPQEWDAVLGATVRRLGRATPSRQDDIGEAFSVETFLTNWNRLDKQAKSAMFGGTRYNRLSNDLDAIARTADRIREAGGVLANPSGTANRLVSGVPYAAIATAAATGSMTPLNIFLGSVGSSAAAEALMLNPKFVRWLARSRNVTGRQIPGYMSRLANALKDEGPEVQSAGQEALNQMADFISTFETPDEPYPSIPPAPPQPQSPNNTLATP